MGCGPSKEAANAIASPVSEQPPTVRDKVIERDPSGLTQPLIMSIPKDSQTSLATVDGPSTTPVISRRVRDYSSSGDSSDAGSEEFHFSDAIHNHGTISRRASLDGLCLNEIRESVHADGQIGSKVIRMETPLHTGPVLGSGVSGIVRLVVHKATGVKYAVKCLDLGLIKSDEGLAQLREEIHIMCQLDHPNIVRLEEVYEGISEIYLVMELCVGGDLFDRLDKQTDFHYTEAQCARLIKQMLSSVRYLHSKNIIHRDLKLENFLFSSTDPESVLKMIDFGLSKHFAFGEVHHEAVGTPYTVAPEIIKGSYNEKGDIWAIGVITYLLLSGETPFGGVDGEDLLEVRDNILRGSFLFEPADVWEHVSPLAKDFVSSTLRVEADLRPSAKEAQRHEWIKTFSKKPNDEGSKLNRNVVQALVSFKEFSDMRKLLCEVLSFTLLPEQIVDLREEFEKFDNGEGEISLMDLKKVLLESAEARALGGMTEQEVEDIFNALRVRKKDPKIRWHEFIAAGLSQCAVDERNLKLAFDRLDTNRKGYITFDNIMDLVGDEENSKEELRSMWIESLQYTNVNLDRIRCDDFLIIMKGQALGQSMSGSQEFRHYERRGSRSSAPLLESVAEMDVESLSQINQRFLSSLGEMNYDGPLEDVSENAPLEVSRGRRIEEEACPTRYHRARSRSLEHNKIDYFEGDDASTTSITIEDVNKMKEKNPPRHSLFLAGRSKRNIEAVIEDESKSSLVVNKSLYRAHREMRLAVLEASKRFEENQRRHELLEEAKEEGKDLASAAVPWKGLVMRRGTLEDAGKQSSGRIEQEEIDHASKRAGRKNGRGQRRKTVSDMTGFL